MPRERGHAVVFVLALLACLVAAAGLVHESGRLAAQKRRLIDAADAAAMSAAVFEARVLNFEAYMNRAIVANQAALAQSVSLRSWLDYMARTADRADRVARFVPWLGQASRALRSLMAGANRTAQPFLLSGELALASFSGEFAFAAESLHRAAAPVALDLLRATAAGNFPGAVPTPRGEALLAAHAARWAGHTRSFTGAARARQKDVIVRSLDRFTVERGATPARLVIVRLEKRGGTDLLGYDTWRGMDTFALHRRDLFGWKESFQIGWGAAEQGLRSSARGVHGNSYRVNGRTSRTAARQMRSSRLWRGLPAMRDVAQSGQGTNDLRLDLELALPVAAAGGEPLSMTALASARVFHARPVERLDRRRELASLYSPYWQARLAPAPWLALP